MPPGNIIYKMNRHAGLVTKRTMRRYNILMARRPRDAYEHLHDAAAAGDKMGDERLIHALISPCGTIRGKVRYSDGL